MPGKGGDMEDETRVIAGMDRKKKIRLDHVLLDEGRTFSAWLPGNSANSATTSRCAPAGNGISGALAAWIQRCIRCRK